MKKFVTGFLAATMMVGLLAGCGQSSSTSSQSGSEAATDGPQTVTFWYAYKGDEAAAFENAIAAYNESQSKYKVEGLSVTDQQKLIVALSSNEGPDAFSLSNQDVISYQNNGLLEDIQTYVDNEGYDLGIYSEKSVEANSVDGRIYALPLSGYTIQMFYNKDLLAEIGYTETPETWEELYEMAVKATVLDDQGNIEVLGYPLFPLASARQELIYGFGGRWWDEDSNLTPEDPNTLASLKMNMQYRELYGVEKVQSFIATANTNRYTEQDMFFAGKQLFRLDGSWLPTMMENFGSTVNYGIALIPGTEANPDARGTSRYETSSVAIPVNSKNKEGAWDFIKWLSNAEGNKILLNGIGNLPALKELYTDPDILAKPGFPEFIEALELEKGIQYPKMNDFSKYVSLIDEQLDYIYNGMKTPEEGLADLAEQAKGLS